MEELIKDLVRTGLNKNNIYNELKYLVRQKLIISETQDVNNIDENDLISITTSGRIHLEMIYNVDYLSSCSEDSWYNIDDISLNIRNNMLSRNKYSHLSLLNTLENAEILAHYLSNYFDVYFKKYSEIFETKYSKPIDFQKVSDLIENSKFKEHVDENILLKNGTIIKGTLNNITTYGLFINLPDSKYVGFVETNKIKSFNAADFEIGEQITVKVSRFNTIHNKYELDLLEE